MRLALGLAALWLAVEPPLRALLWWGADLSTHRTLHGDIHWLAIGLILPLLDQVKGELRRQLDARPWLLPLALLWAAAAILPLLGGYGSPVSLRWPIYLAAALALLGGLRQRPVLGGPLLVAAAAGFLGLAAVVAAFAAVTPLSPGFDWIGQLPGAPNVRNLGYEAVVVAVIGSLYRPAGASAAVTLLLRAAAVAAWWLIFWSGGRGALLATVATLLVALLAAAPGGRRRQLAEVLLLMAIGAALSLLHTPPNPAFGFWRAIGFDPSADGMAASDVSTGRFAIWSESVRAIGAHPLLGIGEGRMKTQFVSAMGTYAHPHNVILQAPLAWGLPAGAVFLFAVTLPLWRAGRRVAARASITAPATAAAAAALVLTAHALLDGTLYHPRPVVMFLVAAAVALTAPTFDKARTSL